MERDHFQIGKNAHFHDFVACRSQSYDGRVPFWRLVCGRCNLVGHSSRFCKDEVCTYCTYQGHTATECEKRLKTNKMLYELGYVTQRIDPNDRLALALDIPANFAPVRVGMPNRRDYRSVVTGRFYPDDSLNPTANEPEASHSDSDEEYEASEGTQPDSQDGAVGGAAPAENEQATVESDSNQQEVRELLVALRQRFRAANPTVGNGYSASAETTGQNEATLDEAVPGPEESEAPEPSIRDVLDSLDAIRTAINELTSVMRLHSGSQN